MAGSQKGFYWRSDTLFNNVKVFPARLDRAIVAATEYGATIGEAHARQTAPWSDQTSNARNNLTTQTQHVPLKTHRIILSHGMPYGIWLEVRWAGKYRVIVPTIRWTGAEVMTLLNGILNRSDF